MFFILDDLTPPIIIRDERYNSTYAVLDVIKHVNEAADDSSS
jgi:hypothetical protein